MQSPNIPTRHRPGCAIKPIVIAVALGLAACARSPVLSATAAGHEISARVEGQSSIETSSASAVIKGAYGVVTIETDRMRLDDLAWVPIPPAVPVDIQLRRHAARISAGSVTIERSTTID